MLFIFELTPNNIISTVSGTVISLSLINK